MVVNILKNSKYSWTKVYWSKDERKWLIQTILLSWEDLSFKYRYIRCHELCFHASFKGHLKCTLGENEDDVCAFFMTSAEVKPGQEF